MAQSVPHIQGWHLSLLLRCHCQACQCHRNRLAMQQLVCCHRWACQCHRDLLDMPQAFNSVSTICMSICSRGITMMTSCSKQQLETPKHSLIAHRLTDTVSMRWSLKCRVTWDPPCVFPPRQAPSLSLSCLRQQRSRPVVDGSRRAGHYRDGAVTVLDHSHITWKAISVGVAVR